jgi:hypothetical protein
MAAYPGFVYGSNESQSPWADMERTVNWYRRVQQGQATGFECCKADLAAYLTPPSA